MDGLIEEKSWRFAEKDGEASLEHYAELLAYMLHDREVPLSDALSIHGISEALWHRADAHWSEELCATPSWYRVRLAMEFGAAFMRTRIALQKLDGIEPRSFAHAEPRRSETEAEVDDEDRPTLPEVPQSASDIACPLEGGGSEHQLNGVSEGGHDRR